MNRTILTGRLTKTPELKKTQSGSSVCSFTLAVDRQFKKSDQPEADFISCVAWNKTADLMVQYLHKGSLIGVEGRIQTRSYDNQQGQKVYVTEVITDSVQFLEPKSNSQQQQEQMDTNTYSQQPQAYNEPQMPVYGQSLTEQAAQAEYNGSLEIEPDDLPF